MLEDSGQKRGTGITERWQLSFLGATVTPGKRNGGKKLWLPGPEAAGRSPAELGLSSLSKGHYQAGAGVSGGVLGGQFSGVRRKTGNCQ